MALLSIAFILLERQGTESTDKGWREYKDFRKGQLPFCSSCFSFSDCLTSWPVLPKFVTSLITLHGISWHIKKKKSNNFYFMVVQTFEAWAMRWLIFIMLYILYHEFFPSPTSIHTLKNVFWNSLHCMDIGDFSNF